MPGVRKCSGLGQRRTSYGTARQHEQCRPAIDEGTPQRVGRTTHPLCPCFETRVATTHQHEGVCSAPTARSLSPSFPGLSGQSRALDELSASRQTARTLNRARQSASSPRRVRGRYPVRSVHGPHPAQCADRLPARQSSGPRRCAPASRHHSGHGQSRMEDV